MIRGTRVTAIKIGYFRIELIYHELHPTKGWRKSRHSIRKVDKNQYRRAPMFAQHWIPNPDVPEKFQTTSGWETALTRAKHHHPRRERRFQIDLAKMEMHPHFQGIRMQDGSLTWHAATIAGSPAGG